MMRSIRSKTIRVMMTCLLLVCPLGATGCNPAGLFGANFNLNLIVPTGFGGNPGFYNPFGMTQAIVNAFLGSLAGSGGDGGGGGGATPSTVPTSGVIGAVVN